MKNGLAEKNLSDWLKVYIFYVTVVSNVSIHFNYTTTDRYSVSLQ